MPKPPGPHRSDWIDFLYWLAIHEGYDATSIVRVVEKPDNYVDPYASYLLVGGVNRH